MTKAELIYRTLHTIQELSKDKLDDTFYYFKKFLSDKYDEDILEKVIEGAKKDTTNFFSDENLVSSKGTSN